MSDGAYQCPACHGTQLDAALTCAACGAIYPSVDGRPILFKPANDLFNVGDYADAKPDAAIPAQRKSSFTGLSVNLSIDRMIAKLLTLLGDSPRLIRC
jgi:hypothetical protein